MTLKPGEVIVNRDTPESRDNAYNEALDHLETLRNTGVCAFVGAVMVGNDVHVIGVGNPLDDLAPLIQTLAEGLRAAVFEHLNIKEGEEETADEDEAEEVHPLGNPHSDFTTPSSGTKH